GKHADRVVDRAPVLVVRVILVGDHVVVLRVVDATQQFVPAYDLTLHRQPGEDVLVLCEPRVATVETAPVVWRGRAAVVVVTLQRVGYRDDTPAESRRIDLVDCRRQLVALVVVLADADQQQRRLAE